MDELLKIGCQTGTVFPFFHKEELDDRHLNIFQAMIMNRKERVDSLISTDSEQCALHVKAKDELGRCPLYLAAQYGSVKLVEKIVATGSANIEQADNDGWTPLFVACYNGHFDVVQKLLSLSANVEAKEKKFGWTPLFAATWNGHLSIVQLLVQYGAKSDVTDVEGKTPFFIACMRNHSEIVTFFLKTNTDINALDIYQRSALHIAVQMGHENIVRLLVENKCNLDLRDKDGRSALVLAYKLGHERLVGYLISKGANTENLDFTITEESSEYIDVSPCHGRFIKEIVPDPPTKVLAIAEQDDKLWCGCDDGSIIVYHLPSEELLCHLEKIQKRFIHDILIFEDTVWALSGNREIYLWKWRPNAETKNVNDPAKLILVAVLCQPEINCIIRIENEIYGGSCNNTIYVWNAKLPIECKEIQLAVTPFPIPLQEFEKFVSCMLFYRDTLFVAVKKVILYFDAKTLEYKGYFEGHNNLVSRMLALGDKLYSCSRDGSIRCWNISTGKCEKVVDKLHGGDIFSICYTGDDQLLSAGVDSNILSWDIKTLQLRKKFQKRHTREIVNLYWSDRHKRLWVGSHDKLITVWE